MSGNDDGAVALSAFGVQVHKESLHAVWRSCADVDAITSAGVEFVRLAHCSTLEDGSLAAEGQEVLEGQRSVRIKDGRRSAPLKRRVRQIVHALRVET